MHTLEKSRIFHTWRETTRKVSTIFSNCISSEASGANARLDAYNLLGPLSLRRTQVLFQVPSAPINYIC